MNISSSHQLPNLLDFLYYSPNKLTCPLKNSGSKTILSFWNGPFLVDMVMEKRLFEEVSPPVSLLEGKYVIIHRSKSRWLATPKRWRFGCGAKINQYMGVASHRSFPGGILNKSHINSQSNRIHVYSMNALQNTVKRRYIYDSSPGSYGYWTNHKFNKWTKTP